MLETKILKKNVSKNRVLDSLITHNYLYRILVIEGSGLRKRNWLFNLINQQPDADKIKTICQESYEAKHQLLINKEKKRVKVFKWRAFIEYPNDMDDIYKNIEECNLNKKRKIRIVFVLIWLLICLVIINIIQ